MTLNKPSIHVTASGARRTCRVRTQYNSLKEGGEDAGKLAAPRITNWLVK